MRKSKILFNILLFLILGLFLTACTLDKKPEEDKRKPEKPNDKITASLNNSDIEIVKQEFVGNTCKITYKITIDGIKQVLMFYKTYDKQEVKESNFTIIEKDHIKDTEYEISYEIKNKDDYEKFSQDIRFKANKEVREYDQINYYYLLVSAEGTSSKIVKVRKGDKIPYINNNLKDSKFAVKGYYYDSYFNKELTDDATADRNEIIFAKSVLDFSIINKIQQEIIKANVTVYASGYNGTSQGSGGVFYETKKGYYILTNSHVVTEKLNGEISPIENIEIENYKKERAQGYLLAYRPKYDLALLFVYKKQDNLWGGSFWESDSIKDLKPLKLAKSNPSIGDSIIAIGQPKGQKNTITAGYVQGYEKINVQDSVSPDFKTIKHNAPIDHGSSGGILLNSRFEICGVNFAGSTDISSTDPNCYAIPIEKVREMIAEYNNAQPKKP